MRILYFTKNVFVISIPFLIVQMLLLSSCGDMRHLTYMQGKFDTAKLSQINIVEPVIQKGDLLSIIVYSDNPAATALYNQPLIAVASGASNTAPEGGQSSTAGSS